MTEDLSIDRVQQLQMLLPKVLYVQFTTLVRLTVERSCSSQASETRWQSSARYDGKISACSELTATSYQSFRDAKEQRVAVVQATRDEHLD